jgi:hypothetical protein
MYRFKASGGSITLIGIEIIDDLKKALLKPGSGG